MSDDIIDNVLGADGEGVGIGGWILVILFIMFLGWIANTFIAVH